MILILISSESTEVCVLEGGEKAAIICKICGAAGEPAGSTIETLCPAYSAHTENSSLPPIIKADFRSHIAGRKRLFGFKK